MALSTIPDQLYSQETVEYVGFNKIKAAKLWKWWSEGPNDECKREIDYCPPDKPEISFLEIIKGPLDVDDGNDVWVDDDTAWFSCMQYWGIATELQDAIMDKRFKQLRRTRSCVQWILDTIELRYESLEYFMATTPGREEGLYNDTFHPQSSAFDGAQSLIKLLRSSTHPGDSKRGGQSLPETVDCATNFAPPGMIVLYKATSMCTTRNLFGGPLLDAQGHFQNLQYLKAPLPNDFSGCKMMLCFTTSLQAAQTHASYLKRRGGSCHQPSIVRFCIPDIAVQNLHTQLAHCYFPGDDWRKLVWISRASQLYREPGRLSDLILIIGHVASKPDKAFHDLESWEEITEDYVLKLGNDGREADVQYAFRGNDDGWEFLNTHATDIKVWSYPTREYA
ncbi:hypothetical protein ACLX1H_005568 [Fusarium chlamydosporum]